MPFAFLLIGVVFVISGVRNTSQTLLALLNGDLRGSNNYVYWMLSILAIGSLGYIQAVRPFSRAFLVLLIVVLILADDKNGNAGFFSNFTSAISQISNRSATATTTATTAPTSATSDQALTSLGTLANIQ